MKNRKRILSFGMAVLMAVSLCACGGGKGETEQEAQPAESEESAGEEADSAEPTPSGETVNIAALINTDGLAVWYADKMGYFDEVGLDTNITYFVNGTLQNEV